MTVMCTVSGALGQGSPHRCKQAPVMNNLDRAESLLVQGRYTEAIELCNQISQRSGTSYELLLVRADALSYLGQNEKAIADCSKAIAIDPNEINAYQARSDC